MFYRLWVIALFLLGSLFAHASTNLSKSKGNDQNVIDSLTSAEVFPTVLTSNNEIELRRPIAVRETTFLRTPQLTNPDNCILTAYKRKKKEKNNHNIYVGETCEHVTQAVSTLPPFKFYPTNDTEAVTLKKKKQIFTQGHLPSLNINKHKTTLIFKAPVNSEGKRVQHIGKITDRARHSVYTFHEGDYYIDSLDIGSEHPKKSDLFILKTKGKVRLFLNNDSKIVKRADEYEKRGYIELNYKKKNQPQDLIIFSKGNLTIDASRRLKMQGFIYGYQDIDLITNINATYKGAVTAQGKLTLGKEEPKHWKQEKTGEFIYKKENAGKLYLIFETDVTEDTEAPVITLNGDKNLTVLQGRTYVEEGATATDNRDGDVSVQIEGSVDTNVPGSYMVTYTATDRSGNSAAATRTVTVAVPQMTSLSIESNATSVNLGESALLTLYSTYADGHTEEVTENIVWEITPADSVEIDGNVLTAKKEGEVSIKAKVKSLVSDALVLELFWEVDKHRLPPEPNKELNDSTLLGIDVNDNGVRDDVERWIYKRYKDEHPIMIPLKMQEARAFRYIIQDPSLAKERDQAYIDASSCRRAFGSWAEAFGRKPLFEKESEVIIKELREREVIQFNTSERGRAYGEYNQNLSGMVFEDDWPSESWIDGCDFNTTPYIEMSEKL